MYRKPLTIISNKSTLRKKSKDFDFFNGNLSEEDKASLHDLQDTFNVLEGYGLALPQIGIQKRAVVVNLTLLGVEGHSNSEVMVNPILETWGDDQRNMEACFSVPHVSAPVTRPKNCRVSYKDVTGKDKSIEVSGYASACLQHEIDHLDGILYIDRLGRVYSQMLVKKALKEEKKIIRAKELARLEFENEHREIDGKASKKTTHSKKRQAKARKKRPRRSKKKK